jgi:hypothetical protein
VGKVAKAQRCSSIAYMNNIEYVREIFSVYFRGKNALEALKYEEKGNIL